MRSLKQYISSDVALTQANQVWRAGSGLITLLLIPIFLSGEEQGYWFTMMSLATLSMLADLGFFNITLQFAAHEFAHLRFDGKTLVGEESYKNRLASLFVFCLKWALIVTALAFPVILIIGFLFLGQKETLLNWTIPWIVYAAGAGLTFLSSAIIYFIEGCDSVGAMQAVRLMMGIVAAGTLWCGLALGWSLYALPVSTLAGAAIGLVIMLRRYLRLFRYFFSVARGFSYSWRSQFLTLLWRYALSWSSGYFIFQAYTPIMFYFHGPIEAGKVGLSIMLWMGVFSVANAWIYAATPRINMHVSRSDWPALDILFRRNLALSVAMFIAGALLVLLGVYALRGRLAFVERLVDPLPMLLLAVAWFVQIIVNGLAVYLRAFKQEPLVLTSVVSAIYITLATLLCARYLSADYFFLGLVSSYLWGVPWILHIFVTKRRLWQTA